MTTPEPDPTTEAALERAERLSRRRAGDNATQTEPVGLSAEIALLLAKAHAAGFGLKSLDHDGHRTTGYYDRLAGYLAARLAAVPRDDGLAAAVAALAEEVEAGGSIWVTTTRLRTLLAADAATGQEGT